MDNKRNMISDFYNGVKNALLYSGLNRENYDLNKSAFAEKIEKLY